MITESLSTGEERLHETDPSDADLLATFVSSSDARALEAIVLRHQTMVMGVCCRVLSDADDRDDAFQATFFVLARDARKIRKSDSLASWLYGVAYRTAIKAAHNRVRRRERPLEEAMAENDNPLDTIARRHEHRALDEEVNSLPEKYRRPLVLRYLTGKSNGEIAKELGLSIAAVEGRLKRGKRQLRVRLAKRGIGLSIALGAITLAGQTASASDLFIQATAKQAVIFQRGVANVGGSAVTLAREVEMANMAILGSKVLVTSVAVTACFFVSILGVAAQVGSASGAGGTSNGDLVVQAEPSANKTQGNSSPRSDLPILEATVVPKNNPKKDNAAILPDAPLDANSAITSDVVRKIESKLQEYCTLEFREAPLKEVVQVLQKKYGLNVALELHELNDRGIDANMPVTCNISRVSIRTALRLILDELKLAYTIKNEMLVITAEEAAIYSVDSRLYPVDHLKQDSEDKVEFTERIIVLITSMIEPESWSEAGGPGTAMVFQDRLIISNSQYVHEKIAGLLEILKKSHREATVAPSREP